MGQLEILNKVRLYLLKAIEDDWNHDKQGETPVTIVWIRADREENW